MTSTLVSQKENKKPLEPSAQVIEDEVIFQEEHKAIYDAFIDSIKNKVQSEELKGNGKIVLNFILRKDRTIFKNVKLEGIKPLSEENFCEFLLGVLKEVRERKLANEENFKNGRIKQVIDDCIDDIRVTEAKDSLVKVVGLPFGIKLDPKNISSSFMNGMKEKIPFLGKDKKEEDEPPLSDQEMVTKFLRKVFLPILFSVASILIFGPTTLAIVAAVIGTIFAVKGGVEVLFSNNKPGTLYDPSSQDRDAEKRAKLNEKICNGIDDIFAVPAKEIPEQIFEGNGENKQYCDSEQICSPRKETPATLKQPTLDQPAKSIGQQTDLPNM